MLLLYVALLWSSMFFVEHEISMGKGGYLFDLFLGSYDLSSPNSKILAAFLVFIQAVFVNVICSRQRLTEEVTLIPGLTYILLSSISPQFMCISPNLMANFFILLALYEMFETYNIYSCADKIYNVGLWVALAGLFSPPYLLLVVLAFIGLSILRANKFKESLILIIGFISPFILIMTYKYWKDSLAEFYKIQFSDNLDFMDFSSVSSVEMFYTLGFFILLILITLFSVKTYNYRMKMKVQKNINILYFYLVTSIITVFFQNGINLQHLMLLIPALSILISINFVRMPRHWAEIFHLFLLVAVILWQYLPLLNLY